MMKMKRRKRSRRRMTTAGFGGLVGSGSYHQAIGLMKLCFQI